MPHAVRNKTGGGFQNIQNEQEPVGATFIGISRMNKKTFVPVPP